ncbi:hypothetical protein [Pseudomonas sp. D(2018)]|uniref:hypothetical protein n=1 Tax=Pseudomonas sp. D(2018) TaxID=2502238 RepID=UPI0010F94A42|nr:hypothetical protein [Pseudomonas sp. D(2018)]
MNAMELAWALLSGAILLIVLLMLALFWQELRVRYGQEALADMRRRLEGLQAANEALRRENREMRAALRATGQYLTKPSATPG